MVWVYPQVKTKLNIIFTVTTSFESDLIAYSLTPITEPEGSSLQPRHTTVC
jgi:hypothetical protein